MLNQWIEVFKTGTHTDSSGHTDTWTDKDIEEIVSKYNPGEHEAPIVIGHPKTNAPAYGWVEGLKRAGDKLLAKFKQVAPEFIELVKAGRYKKRSISIDPKTKRLRHIGFLGAAAPAIKGLADIKFNEDDIAVSFEFTANRENPLLIEFEEKPDTAEKNKNPEVENNMDWEKLAKELEAKNAKLEADNETLKTENKEFSEKLETVTGELETSKLKITELEGEKREADFNSFCDALMEKGKMTPAEKDSVIKTMNVLADADTANFSEGNKSTCLDDYKKTLEKRPEVLEFRELATKAKAGKEENKKTEIQEFGENVDEAELELDRKIVAYAEKHNVSYEEAVENVCV